MPLKHSALHPAPTSTSNQDDLHLLMGILPVTLQVALAAIPHEDLLEIVMDLGRPPQARFTGKAVNLLPSGVTQEELNHVIALVGQFGADNRAGIEGTLHRISALRNRSGRIIGLTLRIGRVLFGTIDAIRDLIERGANVLLLGRPGVGKTTKLREIARVLADELGKRVVVVDTSNEIGGDGDVPHPAIGGARRLQVPRPEQQHGVMIEAVENHMPEVIVVDEIGTAAETSAARTIAERGVQLIGTAHGNTLSNLIANPTLCDLVGGVQTVTLSDDEARLRGTQKTISERKGPATFTTIVEIIDRDAVIVHQDTARAVDKLLRGMDPGGTQRSNSAAPTPIIAQPTIRPVPKQQTDVEPRTAPRIYAYALSRDIVEKALRDLRLDARTVRDPERATMVIALRSRVDDPRLKDLVATLNLSLYEVKKNTTSQVRRLLQNVFNVLESCEDDEICAAVREAEEGVARVIRENIPVELPPRTSSLRQLQHRIVVRNRLIAESEGGSTLRHLVIYPG